MLKRPITYTNPFNDEEVTEVHYFHISKADLVTMEMEEHGATWTTKEGDELTGMQAKLQEIVDSNDGKAIMRQFEDIIRRAYGKKDGDRFLKSQEIWDNFRATEAYSQLLWELVTEPDAAADFVNGVIPPNLSEIAEDVRKQAELQAKGRAAQAEARAAAPSAQGGTPEAAVAEAAPAAEAADLDTSAVTEPATQPTQDPAVSERVNERDNATPENPVVLTPAEMREMDSDDLQSGLATGRFKLQ